MISTDPWWRRAIASLRSQWLATTLTIPLVLLGINSWTANQAAKEARIQAAQVERVAKLQESGKALDLALAGYFQSVADLSLSERKITSPGSYDRMPVKTAQTNLVQARASVHAALVNHASDVQALRGAVEQDDAALYMSALADMTEVVDTPPSIHRTGGDITVLGRLVQTRNRLVDDAIRNVS